jgi:enoyl-CoA hydratase
MTYTNLLCEISESIVLVTINRPEKLNALNRETFEALSLLFADLERDAAARAVIITGAGEKAFVAGADISNLTDLDAWSGREWARLGQRTFSQIENMPKPVIAAINGYALGGGLELAMACHIRIAAAHARMGLPEVKLGLIPGNGGTQRLPRLICKGRALEMILTGDPVTAEEAWRIGLVNRVTAPAELIPTTRKLAATILQNGPVAIELCLDSIRRGLDTALDAALELEAAQSGVCSGSEDAREGTRAFLDKRKPVFTGR